MIGIPWRQLWYATMSKRGFTLIELVAAVMIAGLASTLALDQLHQAWMRKAKVEQEAVLIRVEPFIETIIRKYGGKIECESIGDTLRHLIPEVQEIHMQCMESQFLQISWSGLLVLGKSKIPLRGCCAF